MRDPKELPPNSATLLHDSKAICGFREIRGALRLALLPLLLLLQVKRQEFFFNESKCRHQAFCLINLTDPAFHAGRGTESTEEGVAGQRGEFLRVHGAGGAQEVLPGEEAEDGVPYPCFFAFEADGIG